MRSLLDRDAARHGGSGAGNRDGGHDGGPVGPEGTLSARWGELHRQAERVARIAQLSPEPFVGDLASFPDTMGDAQEWQRELAWQGIDDIDAMMRPGLAALETLRQRGQPAHVPALALWREFYTARGTILKLAQNVHENAALPA